MNTKGITKEIKHKMLKNLKRENFTTQEELNVLDSLSFPLIGYRSTKLKEKGLELR